MKERVKAYVDMVEQDLEMFETLEHRDEILAEYKRDAMRNASAAIVTVNNRHKAIEAERIRAEKARADAAAKAETVQKVEAAIEEHFTAPTVAEAPKEESPAEQTIEPIAVYEVSFTVRGTLEQLRKLKTFLKEGNYDYE